MTATESSHAQSASPLYSVPPSVFDKHPAQPHLSGIDEYHRLYNQSLSDPDAFWSAQANALLSWDRPFETVQQGDFSTGAVSWFADGQLSASYNCVDRHAQVSPDKAAIIYEADEPGQGRTITYSQLLKDVCQLAGALSDMGVKKGDTVAIYLPMIPEAAVAILACSRIGAIHSVVFCGFSSDALRDRIQDADSKVVLTTDEGRRGGKTVATKTIVDAAVKECPGVSSVLVYRRTGNPVPWTEGRDRYWQEEVAKFPEFVPHMPMDAEDPLFLLYTSGSTGKPKGVMHTTGGYLMGAAATGKYVFDLHPSDVFFCAGDVGWITGHTYVVYAPLVLGVTTIIFEGTPTYPSYSRYWDIISETRTTQFYVAPTALRLLKRAGDETVRKDMSSHLRVLGSVGEPIAAEVWKWYHEVVGQAESHIVDTYWQTETGSHVIAPLGGVTPTKAGSASLPFFGIEPVIIDPVSGEEREGAGVEGVLAFKRPWPSMARTIWGDHERFVNTYLSPYPGYYFTGDGAARDSDGYYWIQGRIDDVVNVSGHRLSTAEIEAALLTHQSVAEAAVVGVNDELTGQAVNCFVSLKPQAAGSLLAPPAPPALGLATPPESSSNSPPTPGLKALTPVTPAMVEGDIRPELTLHVRKSIGPFATPKVIYVVPDLPKTRSGKIMRRVLRKIVAGEEDQLGDVSTLSDPTVVDALIRIVREGKA